MPDQYDIISIGDQVHNLTMQLEIEKILTGTLFRLLQGATGVGYDTVEGMVKVDLNLLDGEPATFNSLRKKRLTDLLNSFSVRVGD